MRLRRLEEWRKYEAEKRGSRIDRELRIRQIIDEAKSNPCMDCGKIYPPYVMDFDHRPGEKKIATLSRLRYFSRSPDRIRQEIAKCDLVCANCHRERTHKRKTSVCGDSPEAKGVANDVTLP